MSTAASRRLFMLCAVLAGPAAWAGDAASVSLETARAELEAGRVMLFDVREPSEHLGGIARGARPLPLSQLSQRAREIPNDPAQPVLLVCNTQNRSRKAVEALRQAGWRNVRYVEGGMSEWARRGWPLVALSR